MNAAARFRHEAGEVLGAEIAWLKSFGWADDRIAERLGITVNAIEQRRIRASKTVATSGDSSARRAIDRSMVGENDRCNKNDPEPLATARGLTSHRLNRKEASTDDPTVEVRQ
jgi:hypothetical protein